MKKLVGVLSMVLVLMYCVNVFAADGLLRYSQILTVEASLSITGGKATCSGAVEGRDSNGSSSVTVRLQKKSGTSWINVSGASWSNSGGKRTSAGGTVSVTSGTYRVVTTGTFTDSANQSETGTATSSTKTI